MSESIDLFATMCAHQALQSKKASMILLLNKKDLFAFKIMDLSITICPKLKDFEGDTRSFDECVEFIKNVFIECNPQRDREIFVHVTCAVDASDVESVWADIKEIISMNAQRNNRMM